MEIADLYQNEGFWTAKIQLDLFRMLEAYMEENNLTRTQLAKKLGVSKGYISQVLNGDFDHRLSKLVGLSLAVGKVPDLSFRSLTEVIDRANSDYRTVFMGVYTNRDDEIIEDSLPIQKPEVEFQLLQDVG